VAGAVAEAACPEKGILQGTRAVVTNLDCTLGSPGEFSQTAETRTSDLIVLGGLGIKEGSY